MRLLVTAALMIGAVLLLYWLGAFDLPITVA